MVEPDPYNPKLHGQVVRFTVPVVYMELTKNDVGEYPNKEVAIGRILIQESYYRTLYDIDHTHIMNKINNNMNFTIIGSYWIRQDWLSRELAPDVQRILVKDENGTMAAALRSILFHSNKPELGK